MGDFSKVEFLQVVQDLFEEIRDVFPVQVRYVTLPINSADTCMFEQLHAQPLEIARYVNSLI